MLILTRNIGEAIYMYTADGAEICIRLLDIHRNIRLGITAPDSIHIVREELLCKTPATRPIKIDHLQEAH